MQSLFILALFGILYSTVAVITTMLSTSAMQQKLQNINYVEQLFEDIETGIKKGYLGNDVDLDDGTMNLNPADGSSLGYYAMDMNTLDADRRIDKWLPRYVSYAGEELLKDPWGTDYIIEMNYMDLQIYADVSGNSVRAPVAVFLLYSAGPDKQFGNNNPPNTYTGMQRFTAPNNANGEDDIVRTFTTLETAQEMWNHTQEVFDKMVSAVSDNYKQQYDLFAPTIQTDYYDVVNFYDASFNWIGDDPAPGCSTALIHAWKDPACPNNLTAYPDFPVMYPNTVDSDTVMMENLGIDAEYERMIPGFLSSLDLTPSNGAGGYFAQMQFSVQEDANSQWDITYSQTLQGSDIISGL